MKRSLLILIIPTIAMFFTSAKAPIPCCLAPDNGIQTGCYNSKAERDRVYKSTLDAHKKDLIADS